MKSVYNMVAGLDVHKKTVVVVVLHNAQPDRDYASGVFGTTQAGLRELVGFLRQHNVKDVAMESTAQYWRPVWMSLESDFNLTLAQARSTRARRGRKWDRADAQRIARRLLSGDLTVSFVPPPEQRDWRLLSRTQVAMRESIVRPAPPSHALRRTNLVYSEPDASVLLVRNLTAVALAILAARPGSTHLTAQWLKYPTAGVPRKAGGKVDLSAATPRLADGKPDFSGIWTSDSRDPRKSGDAGTPIDAVASRQMSNLGVDLPGGLPYQPWLVPIVKERTANLAKDDPTSAASPTTFCAPTACRIC